MKSLTGEKSKKKKSRKEDNTDISPKPETPDRREKREELRRAYFEKTTPDSRGSSLSDIPSGFLLDSKDAFITGKQLVVCRPAVSQIIFCGL